MLKKVTTILLLSLLSYITWGQDLRTRWVDSVFATLDRQAKIGQLFFVSISSFASAEEIDKFKATIDDHQIGGFILTQGGPYSHARLLNESQKKSKVPLLAGLSAEWGLAQTMDSVMSLQKPLVASSWKADDLRAVWAREIARQMKTLGFHLNLAPHADHKLRSDDYLHYFGNDISVVARNAQTFTTAMKQEGILTVAKHLPHLSSSPVSPDTAVLLSLNQIDTVGLQVIQRLIKAGVDGILISNLRFLMQAEKGVVPAAVSPVFISEVLRKRLRFSGLVFGEVKDFEKTGAKVRPGEAELLAFESGSDILVDPVSISTAIKKISKRLKKDKILQQQLDSAVKKILRAKYDAGLSHWSPVDTDNLLQKLHQPQSELLRHRLTEASITTLQNRNLLPVHTLEDKSFVSISVGREAENEFVHYLKKYAPFKAMAVRSLEDTSRIAVLPDDVVIVSIFPGAKMWEKDLRAWIRKITRSQNTIVVHFGNPQAVDLYSEAGALIAAYTDEDYAMPVVAQSIFGAVTSPGIFPIAQTHFPMGTFNEVSLTGRLQYTLAEAAGVDSRVLQKIKSIMKEAIDIQATPGCHTLVAKDGKVIYDQSSGWLTYENKDAVTDETIYDLASITKVAATLQTTMFLYDHGMIDLNKKASVYLPDLRESNKRDFILKDILTHQAGLWPTIFFWTQTVKGPVQLPEYYSSMESPDYPFPVSGNIFATKSMKDSLWQWTVKGKIREKPSRTPYDYRYSDMGSYILHHMAESMLNQPMEDFLQQNLYEPLGAYTMGYLPLRKFPLNRIAPTENDTIFRRTLLTGYVHDQGAAMHGGIAGHAGLFSTANDLAKLGQLWLQKGNYAGTQYFKASTIDLFATKQYKDSRRGLGWDKPPASDWSGPTSLFASGKTFGHTGFTGTCIWVDPEFNLVFIFLSNRVHPDVSNKLLNANIRPRIQEVVYQAIFNYCAVEN